MSAAPDDIRGRNETFQWQTTAQAAAILFISTSVPTWDALSGTEGWQIALGAETGLYWSLVTLWSVLVLKAILRNRQWWLLLSLPPILYPAVSSLLLLAACLTGDCI